MPTRFFVLFRSVKLHLQWDTTVHRFRFYVYGILLLGKSPGRTPWSEEEGRAVKAHFHQHILEKRAPRKQDCELFLNANQHMFKNKDWIKIKTYVYNCYRV